MNALDLINRRLAAPKNFVVVTRYADGRTRRHETETMGQAKNWQHLESGKIGRDLINRNTGDTVRVVGVDIAATGWPTPA